MLASGKLALSGRGPAHVDRAVDRHARLIHGKLLEHVAAAGGFQRDEASEAVSEEKLRTGGCLHRRQVVALAVDAVVVSLRSAPAAPSALDRDHGETLGELPRECVEVVRHRKRARDDQNARPLADGLVGDLRAIPGNDRIYPSIAAPAHAGSMPRFCASVACGVNSKTRSPPRTRSRARALPA